MSSRTKNWNRKPGDPLFDRGYNAEERRRRRAIHAGKKTRQELFWKRLEMNRGKNMRKEVEA